MQRRFLTLGKTVNVTGVVLTCIQVMIKCKTVHYVALKLGTVDILKYNAMQYKSFGVQSSSIN